MAKTLLVPDHIVQAKKKEKLKPAYVEKNDRVLDPTLLDKKIHDRLPQPTGWRILVMPYQGKEMTDKGIIIPDHVRQREALATVVAYVLLRTMTAISLVMHQTEHGAKRAIGFVLAVMLVHVFHLRMGKFV